MPKSSGASGRSSRRRTAAAPWWITATGLFRYSGVDWMPWPRSAMVTPWPRCHTKPRVSVCGCIEGKPVVTRSSCIPSSSSRLQNPSNNSGIGMATPP